MIEERLKEQLYKIGLTTEKINKIILFGSRAVGDNLAKSDIDLAFVAPEMSEREWTSFTLDLEEELDTLLFLDMIKFEEAPTQLKNEIIKNGKVLYCDDTTLNETEANGLIEK